jgi:hypothetical protein
MLVELGLFPVSSLCWALGLCFYDDLKFHPGTVVVSTADIVAEQVSTLVPKLAQSEGLAREPG